MQSSIPAADTPQTPIFNRLLTGSPSPDAPSKRPILVKCIQPTKDELKALGVKCRDFAYESSLPPVRPYVRRQIQPDVEKRPREGDTLDRDSKRHKIERVPTEPALDVSPSPPRRNPLPGRTHALVNLGHHDSTWTPLRISTDVHASPDLNMDESEIATPLVTPRGTLHWRSRESDVLPSFTPSLVGSRPTRTEVHLPHTSPLQAPHVPSPRIHSLTPHSPVKAKPSLSFSSSLSSLTSSNLSRHHTPTPRYFLRSRRGPRPGGTPTLPPQTRSRVTKAKKPLAPLPPLRKRRTVTTRSKKR